MKLSFNCRGIFACFCLMALSGIARADNTELNLTLPSDANQGPSFSSQPYLLALNEGNAAQGQTDIAPAKPAAEFTPPIFTTGNVHKYLGLGTIVLAGLTMITAPDEHSKGPRQTSGTPHTTFARATGVMAAATVATGLMFHWDDIKLENGFTDPDNLHAMLGTMGALLMLDAINRSANSKVRTNHAAEAEVGAATMVVAIKLVW